MMSARLSGESANGLRKVGYGASWQKHCVVCYSVTGRGSVQMLLAGTFFDRSCLVASEHVTKTVGFEDGGC